MSELPGIAGAIEDAFVKHSCVTAPLLAGFAVASVAAGVGGAAALLLPAALIAGGRCLGHPYPQPGYPGWGKPFPGGNCPTMYQWRIQFKDDRYGQAATESTNIAGPIQKAINYLEDGVWMKSWTGADGVNNIASIGLREYWPDGQKAWYEVSQRVVRLDGNPDNCGNIPPNPYIPGPPYGPNPYPVPPTNPDGEPYIPGRDYDEPYTPGPPFVPIILPIVLGPLILKPEISFPITVPIDIGGISIGEGGFNFNGSIHLNIGSGDMDLTAVMRELAAIKKCACEGDEPPVCPSEVIYLPVYDKEGDGDCEKSQIALQVIPGSYNAEKADAIQRNAELALKGCESEKKPEQKAQVLIFSGVVPSNPVEVFSPEIGVDVVSVKLVIKNDPPTATAITTYPSANQRKYGSIAFSLLPPGAGGSYVYIYDRETYYPLPPRAKPGVIRLLLKGDCQFELFDTGERL